MLTTNTFDFNKIEQLREKLDLRQEDMAELFGVSRVQYNKWVICFRTGGTSRMRDVSRKRVRDSLDAIVWVMRTYGWPTEMTHLEPVARRRELQRMMAEQP
jgi:transcriptional regulator with XRE-family HTH domain